MANSVMGEVELEVAGQPRPLLFTFATFEEIGGKLGLPEFHDVIERIAADLQGQIKMSTLWAVLAAALRDGWPDVEVRILQKSFQPKDLPRVAEALVTALNAAMPQPPKDEEEAADGPPVAAAA